MDELLAYMEHHRETLLSIGMELPRDESEEKHPDLAPLEMILGDLFTFQDYLDAVRDLRQTNPQWALHDSLRDAIYAPLAREFLEMLDYDEFAECMEICCRFSMEGGGDPLRPLIDMQTGVKIFLYYWEDQETTPPTAA